MVGIALTFYVWEVKRQKIPFFNFKHFCCFLPDRYGEFFSHIFWKKIVLKSLKPECKFEYFKVCIQAIFWQKIFVFQLLRLQKRSPTKITVLTTMFLTMTNILMSKKKQKKSSMEIQSSFLQSLMQQSTKGRPLKLHALSTKLVSLDNFYDKAHSLPNYHSTLVQLARSNITKLKHTNVILNDL